MTQRPFFALLAASSLLITACGKKKPEVGVNPNDTPTSQPPAPSPTPPPPSNPGNRTDPGASDAERTALLADLEMLIHFEYDQDAVRPADQAILDRKAAILAANPAVKLTIEGHADERGSDEYNLVLGNKRASATKRYLESKGIDSGRLQVISYGEERPLDPAETEDAFAKNRRAAFKVTAGGDKLAAPR
ncbi:MAG: peptidoglycan-associated lipoprotein Pal [Gemmatimonadota bacterium]